MIDLYAAPTSNGLRATIMLAECGLPYTLHKIDIGKGETKTADFLKLNPMGLIPVIVDREGPGGKPLTIAQSVAIMLYLGDKAGKFIPKEPAAKAVFHDALLNAATDIGATLGSVFAISRSPEPHQPSKEIFEKRLANYFAVWNGKLAERKYCAGDEITAADFALYAVAARCRQLMPALTAGNPNLDRWESELAARPGVQKGMAFG
jgi:GST-like protein